MAVLWSHLRCLAINRLSLAFVLFCVTGFILGQEKSTEEYPSVRLERLGAAIREEARQRPRETWEAVYYGGLPSLNETVTRLFVSAKKGYVCIRTKSGDDGTVRRVGDKLLFKSDYGDWGPGHATDTKEFVSVSWSKRLYLIEFNRLIEFCNAVNAGKEPRKEKHREFLLREDDWNQDVSGAPNIPKEFQRFLLTHPIECTVMSVDQSKQAVSIPGCPYGDGKWVGTLATVDAGQKQRLLPGMTLFLTAIERYYYRVYVLRCEESTSQVLLWGAVYPMEESWKKKVVGLRLTTRPKPFEALKAKGK